MYNRVYTMSNENVCCYKNIYNFDNARVLSVLGSGDQYFSSLLYGACEVDVIDINYTAWLYFRIKFKAIKMLNYNEFIDLFINRRFNDMDIYNKLYLVLDDEEMQYYIYLIGHINNNLVNDCFNPMLIGRTSDSWKNKGKIIPYLSEDNYYILKEIIMDKELPVFYNEDFMKMKKKNGYNILLLSNIYDYIEVNADEYCEYVLKYGADEALVRYCWCVEQSFDKFIKNGVVIDKVRGTFTRKNYVLSLRR